MPGRISLATFLHLKTNEPPEDRSLSLTAILADAINLGLAKMAEVCPGTSLAKPAWLVAWHIRGQNQDGDDGTVAQSARRLIAVFAFFVWRHRIKPFSVW
jgi:Tn3 transposase DDE domain-containing protein